MASKASLLQDVWQRSYRTVADFLRDNPVPGHEGYAEMYSRREFWAKPGLTPEGSANLGPTLEAMVHKFADQDATIRRLEGRIKQLEAGKEKKTKQTS